MENLFKEELFDASTVKLNNCEKEFICDCGRKFYGKQSFNGHQGKCRIHLGEDKYLQARQRSVDALRKGTEQCVTNRQKERDKKQEEWDNSVHVCERCGKQYTEKFGTGRFCSDYCSRARKLTQEEISKRTQTLQKNCMERYYQNPRICSICGDSLPYGSRLNRETCSQECHDKLIMSLVEQWAPENMKRKGFFKWGTYKGIHCDSSWELAYVMYNLYHDIEFERCRDHFTYYDKNGKSHEYFPDFIQDGEYIEIKNYSTETVELKLQAVIDKGHKIKVLYKKDISLYISYAKNTYGKQYYNLYDQDKPSFKDQVGNKNK